MESLQSKTIQNLLQEVCKNKKEELVSLQNPENYLKELEKLKTQIQNSVYIIDVNQGNRLLKGENEQKNNVNAQKNLQMISDLKQDYLEQKKLQMPKLQRITHINQPKIKKVKPQDILQALGHFLTELQTKISNIQQQSTKVISKTVSIFKKLAKKLQSLKPEAVLQKIVAQNNIILQVLHEIINICTHNDSLEFLFGKDDDQKILKMFFDNINSNNAVLKNIKNMNNIQITQLKSQVEIVEQAQVQQKQQISQKLSSSQQQTSTLIKSNDAQQVISEKAEQFQKQQKQQTTANHVTKKIVMLKQLSQQIYYCSLCQDKNSNHLASECPNGIDLYHGTKVDSIQSILDNGFFPGANGRLGPGLYLTNRLKEAAKIASARGSGPNIIVFQCRVNLQKCFDCSIGLQNTEQQVAERAQWPQKGYTSCKYIHPPWKEADISYPFNEWVISDDSRVKITRIYMVQGQSNENINAKGIQVKIFKDFGYFGKLTDNAPLNTFPVRSEIGALFVEKSYLSEPFELMLDGEEFIGQTWMEQHSLFTKNRHAGLTHVETKKQFTDYDRHDYNIAFNKAKQGAVNWMKNNIYKLQ